METGIIKATPTEIGAQVLHILQEKQVVVITGHHQSDLLNNNGNLIKKVILGPICDN